MKTPASVPCKRAPGGGWQVSSTLAPDHTGVCHWCHRRSVPSKAGQTVAGVDWWPFDGREDEPWGARGAGTYVAICARCANPPEN